MHKKVYSDNLLWYFMVLFVILVLPKNYLADNENYLAENENYLADSDSRKDE